MTEKTKMTKKIGAPAPVFVPSNLLCLKEVLKIVPFCRSSIYDLMDIGMFPLSVKVGKRRVAWIEEEIREWIKSLPRHKDLTERLKEERVEQVERMECLTKPLFYNV